MRKIYRWKFLREGLKSNARNYQWEMGKWEKHPGKLNMCNEGFHCSLRAYQAFSYVQGEILAKVEVRGNHDEQEDKEVWSEMKIVKAYKWQKADSVALAIFAAEQVIDIYERYAPNDDRPRKAIEAAKRYLKDPSEENRSAAESAARSAGSAAWSAARSAESAAWSAAWSAWSAAWSARSAAEAARSAAEAARSAAEAARSAAEAARSAAEAAMVERIATWMDKRIKKLEPLT